MKTLVRAAAVVVIGPLLMTACGGGGGKDPVVTTPPVVTPPTSGSFQSKFGTSFATAFNASSTANAIDPTAADVPAVNLTASPEDN